MAVDKEKNKQILVTFPIEMLEEIEDHWHKEKFQNRNEAIRDLVRRGLDKNEE